MSKAIVLLGVLAVGSSVVLGCGSSSNGNGSGGPATDFTALRAEYSSPSGSLQASDVVNVGNQLASQQSQSTSVPTTSSSAPIHVVRVKPGSAHPMDTPVTCDAATASGVTCSCGTSGTIDETFSGSAGNGATEGTITYDDCSFDDSDDSGGSLVATDTVSGTMSFADYTTAPVMEIFSGSLTETITPPGTTTTETFNYALVGGEITYSVKVSSGTVLVSATGSWDVSTESGSFAVTDKNGTWTCTLTSGAGTCTGPTGSITIS